jgi:hypothetical protein
MRKEQQLSDAEAWAQLIEKNLKPFGTAVR